jgi:hypothetical protein
VAEEAVDLVCTEQERFFFLGSGKDPYGGYKRELYFLFVLQIEQCSLAILPPIISCATSTPKILVSRDFSLICWCHKPLYNATGNKLC